MIIEVRLATLDDLHTVVEFSLRLIQGALGRAITTQARLAAGVRAVLTESGHHSRYYLAEQSGRPVGQAMVTAEWDDWSAQDIWFIRRLYITPRARRTGVATELLRRIRDDARTAGAVGFLRANVQVANGPARGLLHCMGWRLADQDVFVLDVQGVAGH
jgi:GNAT superfamily N-acetyltransferase